MLCVVDCVSCSVLFVWMCSDRLRVFGEFFGACYEGYLHVGCKKKKESGNFLNIGARDNFEGSPENDFLHTFWQDFQGSIADVNRSGE